MPANDAPFQALEPLRLRYMDSPLPGWLRSVRETVLGLLPSRWRQALGAQQRALLLEEQGGGLRLRAIADRQATLLGDVPWDEELLLALRARLDEPSRAVPRWLLLDGSQVLRRSLSLPASAEPRLRELLAHEIDRQTPFSADQVCYEARVLARDAAARQLRVELVVAPKARIESALAALGPMAEGLAGIDVRDADGERLGVNLLPAANRRGTSDSSRWLNLALLAGTALALWLALWQALDNRALALEALQKRVDAANTDVRSVRKLANEVRNSQAAGSFLATQRANRPTMLEIVADLTRRIPDGTSLEKLSVTDGHIVLIGQSQEAPALVGLLQASDLVKTPALAGAVQRDPRTGRDRFTLTATVAGSEKPKEGTDVGAR